MSRQIHRGQRVTLRADPDEGWERETGVVEEINERVWGTSYLVRLDRVVEPGDDGLREVTQEQFE